MIVVHKKSLIWLGSFIFTLLTVVSLVKSNKSETVATVSLPVSNKVIVIDAGHRSTR